MPVAERTARFEMVDADGHALGRDGWPAQRVLSGEEMASALIHWFDRVSQRHRWVRVRSSAVLDPKGTPDLAVEIWHDVSLERREELLAEHLAKATLALGSSLISDEMLAPLARVSIPGLGDWCSIYVLEGERLRNVSNVHLDATELAAAEEYQEPRS